MRVLCVNPGFGTPGGGSARRVHGMARHLLDAGEDVRLLVTGRRPSSDEVAAAPPFPAERITALPLINRRFDLPLPVPWAFGRAVEEADLVHVLYLSPMTPAVVAAARRHGKPWVVCPAGALPFTGRSQRLKRAFHRLWGRRILGDAARVIAITPAERERIAPYVRDPERIVIIPNAIEPPSASPAPARRLDDRPHVLYLGGFGPTKGAHLLIEALATLSEADLRGHVLVMAGSDRRGRHQAERLAEQRGVSGRIRFAGWLGAEARDDAMASASFVVIPSTLDAMTMVVLEAAAAGTPVLITSACGFPDVGRNGGGCVVEPTVEGVAGGLRSMFAAQSRWPEMGERMRSLAQRYSWTVMTQRYRELFREVVAETARSRGP